MKKSKKIDENYFYNYSLFYLEKWDNSEFGLRQALQKRLYKFAKEDPNLDKEKCYEWIDNTIIKIKNMGIINDYKYAERLIERESLKGSSNSKIKNKLYSKGIEQDIMNKLLQDNKVKDEYDRAMIFAKKQKLGPFDKKGLDHNKQLSKFARNGFNYEIAQKILNSNQDFLEEENSNLVSSSLFKL
jgi:SOS response regulatory protein OraA/RecX